MRINLRQFYQNTNKTYFVTTPIFYVNAKPHIGHLYSAVLADAICRYQKLLGRKVSFSTGTDEHGKKIEKASSEQHFKHPLDFCNKISETYKELFDQCSINYSNFIRTTDKNHEKVVHKFWNILQNNNLIYKTDYQGWYCTADETFLTDLQIGEKTLENNKKIKVSLESGHPVEWTKEVNYMFKLSLFQDKLKQWLLNNENAIKPQKFHNILLAMLSERDLPDLSISRPKQRVSWGIPVPNDNDQTIYVWLDALVNYLTVADYLTNDKFNLIWPPDVHVIGKDILKFHGIYWPAFLLAANLPLPKTIFCHSHWTVNDEKMSKSKGNVISPLDKIQTFSSEGLRYFLLREGVPHNDGNYSDTKVFRILNSELADTLGNLLNRCCGKAINPYCSFPSLNNESFQIMRNNYDCLSKLIESIEQLPDISKENYSNFNFYKTVDTVMATLHTANLFFETLKPWELKKVSANDINIKNQLDTVLNITLETTRICGIILQPIIPKLSEMILNKLNVPMNERLWCHLKPFSWQQNESKKQLSNEKLILFQRIEVVKK